MKVPMLDAPMQPLTSSTHNLAFTGRGFLPDFFSQGQLSILPEASRTTLENSEVIGTEQMLHASGVRSNRGVTQGWLNNRREEGVGGAGSFMTASAFKAKG